MHPIQEVQVVPHPYLEVVGVHPFRVEAAVSQWVEVEGVHPTPEVEVVCPIRAAEVAAVQSPYRVVAAAVVHLIRAGVAGARSVPHLSYQVLLTMKHFLPTRSLL
uniref:Uncharacterized protein n=1 Tax=uncultured marine group II/III euryarchaeote KM3_87_G11 TaxID=1456534 RepID=A0A075HW95_9EURY|nr:hypothetical protein [uncultured marine group II/III euryarchaeote KM3_87_G11]